MMLTRNGFLVLPQPDRDGLKDLTVRAGTSFRLSLRYEAHPTPTIQWYANSREILPSTDNFRIDKSSRDTALVCLNATRDNMGVYICDLSNVAGSTESSCRVTVLGIF